MSFNSFQSPFSCDDDHRLGSHTFKRDMMLALIPAGLTIFFQHVMEEAREYFKRKRDAASQPQMDEEQMAAMEKQATDELRGIIREEVGGVLKATFAEMAANAKTDTATSKPHRHTNTRRK